MISPRKLDDSNRAEIEALSVSAVQLNFVSSVVDSLLEAEEEPGAHAIYWGVYSDETPVGFVMITTRSAVTNTSRTSSGSCGSTSDANGAATAQRSSI